MKKLIVTLLSLAMLFGLVGCAPKASQGVTDTTVKVGNCAAANVIGVPFNAGVKAYFAYVNKTKVNGRTIEFINTDDQGKTDLALACVQSMIKDEKIFAFVGHFGTASVGATLEDIKDAGIPAVYFATGFSALYAEKATKADKNLNIFPVQPVYTNEGRLMVARAKGDFSASKVGIIYTNDDAGKAMYEGAKAQAALNGVTLTAEMVEPASLDVSAAVAKIVAAKVDFVIAASIQTTIVQIILELAKQGNTKDVITSYVNVAKAYSDLFIASTTGKFEVYGNGWIDLADGTNLVDYQLFAANIDATYAANAFSMAGWIAGYYFVEGLKRVSGTLTWAKYIAAMETAPIKTPMGGTIDFAKGARTGTQEMNLSKAATTGWVRVKGLESIKTILGN